MKPDELRALVNEHLEQNDFTRSLEYSSELIKGHHGNLVFEDHSKAGYCYLMLDREAEAADCYTEALKLKPDDALALANRGASYFNLGKMQEAFNDFGKALSLKPELYIPWHYVGLYYMKKYLETGDEALLTRMINAYRHIVAIVPDYGSFPVRFFNDEVSHSLDEFLVLNKHLPELTQEELLTI